MKNLYDCFQMLRSGTKFSQMWRIGTKSSHVWRIGTKSSHNSSHVKNWYQNSNVWRTGTRSSHMWKMWQNCEEMESNAKCSRFGCYFINVRNTYVCCIWNGVRIFHKVWTIGTKFVTYWYHFFTCCEKLVTILHSVKLRSVKFAVRQSSKTT